MAINGNTIIVKRNGTAIAAVKSHEVTTQAELQEVASPTTGAWKNYITRRKEWSLNVNYLVAAVGNLTDLLQVGTQYTIVVCDRNNATSVSGTAIMTTCKQTYTRGNLVAGAFQFKGTGALT